VTQAATTLTSIVERAAAVVTIRIAHQPAVLPEVVDDVVLEVNLSVGIHAGGSHAASVTSIWPVTAAVMSAERRS